MPRLTTLDDLHLDGKTVLVRVDFNVPFTSDRSDISDDSRIRASLPTIEYLVARGCRVVLCCHIGRPKGRVVNDLSVAPVARRLAELLDRPVSESPDCVGPEALRASVTFRPGGVLMLENLRFHPGEESDDPEFAQGLAALGRRVRERRVRRGAQGPRLHAGVARLLPAAAGFLVQREVDVLGAALNAPRRPLVAILGGAKVSDKIKVLEHLTTKVDKLLIGGGMGAAFLKANGLDVGESLVEDHSLGAAREICVSADRRGVELLLPTDVVVADAFSESAAHRVTDCERDSRPAG